MAGTSPLNEFPMKTPYFDPGFSGFHRRSHGAARSLTQDGGANSGCFLNLKNGEVTHKN
jgi:hypothetical protein